MAQNGSYRGWRIYRAVIRKQAQLGEFALQVRIVEGYYDLDTGKVEWTAK